MKPIALLLFLYVPFALADGEADRKAADTMLRCASAYGWVVKHTSQNEKRTDAEQWLRTFYGAAQDLTNKEYALGGLRKNSTELNDRVYRNPKDAKNILERELSYCQDLERTEPQVATSLRKLMQRKSEK